MLFVVLCSCHVLSFWSRKQEESDQDLQALNEMLKSKCTLDEHAHIVQLLADSRQEYLKEINERNAKKVRVPPTVEEKTHTGS